MNSAPGGAPVPRTRRARGSRPGPDPSYGGAVIRPHRRTGAAATTLLTGLLLAGTLLAGCGNPPDADDAASPLDLPGASTSSTGPAATSPTPAPTTSAPPSAGDPTGPGSTPRGPGPAPDGRPGAAPSTASRAPGAAVTLPWPAGRGAEAERQQAGVDGGAQPWLLDPAEVAVYYAQAAYDWTGAEAFPTPDRSVVEVRNRGGARITLTLEQPGRTGPRGIWVVVADRRS